MYVYRNIKTTVILSFALKKSVFFLLYGIAVYFLFQEMGHDLAWLMIPFHMVISWIFYTMEIVGDNSEDPFENYINYVPMTAICRTIEIDLRHMLGEKDLPEKIQPVNGILMLSMSLMTFIN